MTMNETRENWQEIRQKLGNLISWIDGQINRLEKLEDESYIRGAQDMREAALSITNIPRYGGMSSADIRTCFDEDLNSTGEIFSDYEALDIIKRVRNWRADKEVTEAEKAKVDDIQVGDEVIVTYGLSNGYFTIRGIVTMIEDSDILWIACRPYPTDHLTHRWTSREDCEKTGVHFDSIPFNYGT